MTQIEELEAQLVLLQAERDGAIARERTAQEAADTWRERAFEAERKLFTQQKLKRLLKKVVSEMEK